MDEPGAKRKNSNTLWQVVLMLGALGAALSFLLTTFGLVPSFKDWFARQGSVELAGSYDGEIWREAATRDYGWLAKDSWCYPALQGFKSEFRMASGALEQRNSSPAPDPFVTEWVPLKVYISNRGILRLHDTRKKWDVSFLTFEADDPREFRENNRFTKDDGSVEGGNKRLALSCTRCSLSADGVTYDCGK
jgi:hypothetical protein